MWLQNGKIDVAGFMLCSSVEVRGKRTLHEVRYDNATRGQWYYLVATISPITYNFEIFYWIKH